MDSDGEYLSGLVAQVHRAHIRDLLDDDIDPAGKYGGTGELHDEQDPAQPNTFRTSGKTALQHHGGKVPAHDQRRVKTRQEGCAKARQS